MSRYLLLLVVAALAVAIALPGAATASRARCPGFSTAVGSSGATVSGFHTRGVSCAAGQKVVHRWLAGIDHSDGRFVACAPVAGRSGRCSIAHYNCRSRGVPSATVASGVTCSEHGRLVSWRTDFDQEQGSNP
jgi:hypothetical protein